MRVLTRHYILFIVWSHRTKFYLDLFLSGQINAFVKLGSRVNSRSTANFFTIRSLFRIELYIVVPPDIEVSSYIALRAVTRSHCSGTRLAVKIKLKCCAVLD